MGAFRNILALASVSAGGALLYSGITGWKIPYLDRETVEDLKNRIQNAEVFIRRIPVRYDVGRKAYGVWEPGNMFPLARPVLFVPKDPDVSLQVKIEFPLPTEDWDGDVVRLRITNTGKSKSPITYVSLAAVYFSDIPLKYPDAYTWVYTRPVQPVPEIPSGKDVIMNLKDRGWTKATKDKDLGMEDALERTAGIEYDNVGLAVTIFSDWVGNKIVTTTRTLVRMNSEMKKVIEQEKSEMAKFFYQK